MSPTRLRRALAAAWLSTTTLSVGCGEKGGSSADTAASIPNDSGATADLVGQWGACEDYPAGERTCDELCGNVGSVCVPRGCDGYTLIKYVMPSCNSSGGYDTLYDYDCDEVFDVTTSSSSSAECCCR